MIQGLAASLALATMACNASADQWRETFASRSAYDSASAGTEEAVWNQALGKIHPTLEVVNYLVGPATPVALQLGDGSDGPFDISTYASFSEHGDLSANTIRINTERPLNVTSFVLASGWTVEPTGSQPLIIRSLSNVEISGTIQCSGRAGGDATALSKGSGGQPRCGGHAGGDGGDGGGITHDGGPGLSASGSVSGGQGGDHQVGTIVGGGGGGSWNGTTPKADNGSHFSAGGGTGGQNQGDPTFQTKDGGAGGGGGAAQVGAHGGGGGAGGGTVIVHAGGDFEIKATGYILANGGTGGAATATGAGPGGGGGGGSIQVFAGGAIRLYSGDANGGSQALGGTHGTNGTEVGGDGSQGRSWFTSTSFLNAAAPAPGYQPGEEASIVVGDNVQFRTVTQSVITRALDLGSTRATLHTLAFTPSSTGFSVQYAGSDDGFGSDDTGWISDPSSIRNKRYIRLKLLITATHVTSPDKIDEVVFTYDPGLRERFDFRAAGCGRTQNPSQGNYAGLSLGLILLAGLIRIARRQARARQR